MILMCQDPSMLQIADVKSDDPKGPGLLVRGFVANGRG